MVPLQNYPYNTGSGSERQACQDSMCQKPQPRAIEPEHCDKNQREFGFSIAIEMLRTNMSRLVLNSNLLGR